MTAVDLLHANVHSVVLSGMSFRWRSACIRACRAGAFVPHFALHSHVQASCLERAWPAAIGVFPGALAACAAAAPGHHGRERRPEAGAQGKIEGRDTMVRAKSVCTWGWRGTRHRAAWCRQQPQCLAGIGNTVCRIRLGAMGLAGAA